jgi:uncharacterized lipoprotein YddW (UPF0748 family)
MYLSQYIRWTSLLLRVALVACSADLLISSSTAAPRRVDRSGPPPVKREFRGVWVATVANIDWPSKPGLSTEQQKKELIAILDKCVELNFNAVVFQVRGQADAMYDSKLEPWSDALTGQMGQAPNPYYDPLQFAIEEAHRRGLQLHAWFNPYRVRLKGAKGKAAASHASLAHPEVVRKYGKYMWFDPGDPKSEEYFIAVLTDVVKRYDVDGIHIDDYFYPYQETDKNEKVIPFPDEETYKRAVAAGEKLKRDDWRRKNVDHLVERMYEDVKKIKPWVLVGISPFGIWRPENPKGIKGFDAYATLYADSRKWMNEGWVDYLSPQLYWLVESKEQSYPKLLAWWAEENKKERHLWPGNFTSKVGQKPEKKKEDRADKSSRRSRRTSELSGKESDQSAKASSKSGKTSDQSKKASDKSGKASDQSAKKKTPPKKPERMWIASDIIRQIEATRATEGATGNVQFSMKALMHNKLGISDRLKNGLYCEPALVPESTWLGSETPDKPVVTANRMSGGLSVHMKMPSGDEPWQWLVRVQTSRGWKTSVIPGGANEQFVPLPGSDARTVSVSGISRLGREGPSALAKIGIRD